MLVLTTMAVPLARSKVRAERERDLQYAVTEMRHAIDKYKDICDAGYLGPPKQGTNCYPEISRAARRGRETGAERRRQEDALPAPHP